MDEQILAAATQRFASQGYDGVSLATIAGDVGIRAQSIAYHFGNKEKLYEEVVKEFYVRLTGRVVELLPAALTQGGTEDLHRLVQQLFDGLPATDRDMLVTLTTEILHSGRAAHVVVAAVAPALDLAEAHLRQSAYEGAPVRESIALMFIASVFSVRTDRIPEGVLTLRHALWGDGRGFGEVGQILLRGLQSRSPSDDPPM